MPASGIENELPPALFTRTSMCPSSAIARATAACTASMSVTSQGSTTARRPCGLDRRGDLGELLGVAREQRDVGTRLGVRLGDRAADAARGTGHQRGPAVEPEAAHRSLHLSIGPS